MINRGALGLVVILVALFTGGQSAHAGLRFCNKSDVTTEVAIGFIDRERGWTSKGWWIIEGGQCKNAIGEPLNNRYYYYYAASHDGTKYSGATAFCIATKKFTLYQTQYGKNTEADCAEAGLRFAKFEVLDTQGSKNHTIILRSASGSSGPPIASGGEPAPPQVVQSPPVVQQRVDQPPAGPAAQQQPAPRVGTGGAACQRFPNLC